MGYTKDVIKGVSWIGGMRIVMRVASYLRIAITARLLTTSQVGVFGLASLVFALIELLTETGINIFLIQRKDDIKEYIDTAWVTAIARGFLIGIVLFLLSPVIAGFFNAPEVVLLMQVLSITPVIRGFINPSIVNFSRELQFHKEFLYRSSVFWMESLISILLLFVYKTPLALVIGLILSALFEVIISHLFVKPTPRFVFQIEKLKQVIHGGKWLTLTGITTYLYQNFDNIVVGKMLGTESLGVYNYSYKLSMLPITEVSDVITTVTFPTFVKIAHEKERLKTAYIKSLLAVAGIVAPISAILFFFPKEIIMLVLGEKWISGAPVLQVLAVLGFIRALINTSNSPLYAVEMQKVITLTSLISLVTLAVTIAPLVTIYGLLGAGIAAILGSLVSLPFSVYFVSRLFRS